MLSPIALIQHRWSIIAGQGKCASGCTGAMYCQIVPLARFAAHSLRFEIGVARRSWSSEFNKKALG
jgi:hypothetical protein